MQSRPQIKWRYRRSQPKFITFTLLLPIVKKGWDGLQWYNAHTKFRNYRKIGPKAETGGQTY